MASASICGTEVLESLRTEQPRRNPNRAFISSTRHLFCQGVWHSHSTIRDLRQRSGACAAAPVALDALGGDGSSRQIDQDNIGILLLPIENNLLSV